MNFLEKFRMARKGQRSFGLGALIGGAVTLGVVAIVTAFVANITNSIGSSLTGTAAAAAANGTASMAELSRFLPLLGIVIVAVVIIGFLLSSFGRQ